jgi:hypothetical protein
MATTEFEESSPKVTVIEMPNFHGYDRACWDKAHPKEKDTAAELNKFDDQYYKNGE